MPLTASIAEFKASYRQGMTHFTSFMVTLLLTVFVDLLVGVMAGMALEMIFSFFQFDKKRNIFKPHLELVETNELISIQVNDGLNFINIVGLYKRLDPHLQDGRVIRIDLRNTKYSDSTAKEKLRDLSQKSELLKTANFH
jgi:MFS superfamily sulfate permease-like transporter